MQKAEPGGEAQAVERLPAGLHFRAVGLHAVGVADHHGAGPEVEGQLHVFVAVSKKVAAQFEPPVGRAPAGVELDVVDVFGLVGVGEHGAAEGDACAAGVVAARKFEAGGEVFARAVGKVDFGQEYGLAFVQIQAQAGTAAVALVFFALKAAGKGKVPLRGELPIGFGKGGIHAVGVAKLVAPAHAADVYGFILAAAEEIQPGQTFHAAAFGAVVQYGLPLYFVAAQGGGHALRVYGHGQVDAVVVVACVHQLVFELEAVANLPGNIPNAGAGAGFKHGLLRQEAGAGGVAHDFVLRGARFDVVEGEAAEEIGIGLGREEQLEADIGVFHAARVACRVVMHEGLVAFALLALGTQAEGEVVFHNRAGYHQRAVAGFLVARAQAHRAFPFLSWVVGAHHDGAGHGVLPAHQALRPAQDFHLPHIPQRLRAESIFVISGRAAVYRQIQTWPRAGEEGHRAHRRAGAVHAAHGGQIVAAAQIHGIDSLLEQVGGG